MISVWILMCNQTVHGKRTVSKELPGSIVTESLKNRILIPIDISKELAYYADAKYISSINFSHTWENFRDFLKKM